MAHRYLTWLLVSLVPGLLAFTCLLNGGYASIDSPAPSSTVTTSTVDIQVTVPLASTFDPNTDVTVNGTVVPVTGGLIVWTATLNPGFPLQDINGIRAEVILPSGAPGITQQAFTWLPSKARARKITDPADLIGGPLAHGRIGDYIIENDQARFIIQDVNQRDLYSVGAFGGNLIDAELKANPDNDHFIETTPMLNIETVINADTVDILNDGEDGLPAVIRTCGPDDLLDFVNPSTVVAEAGFTTFPPLADDNDLEISGCTSFTLTPDDTHLLMSTEVFNNQAPGAAIPDLPLWVGDWINPAGQLDNWSKDESGWGLGLNSSFEALSWLGIDTADGSEYAWVGIKDLAISHFNSDYFAESGVFITIHHNSVLAALLGFPPFFVVPEGGSLVYERAFAVGDGTGSAAVQLEADVTGLAVGTVEGCVTVGGVALAGSRVSIGGTVGGIYASLDQSVQTRAGACPNYSAPVPAGSYDATAGRLGTPYEGGAATPPLQPVVVTAGATTSGVDFALPATGQLQVSVTDQASAPLPARVAVVGFDPSPEIINTGASLPGFGAPNFGLLHDVDDGLQFGLVAFGYTDVTGSTTFDVEPGSYQVFVSRGTEWSLFDTPVTISAGAVSNVAAQIAPVLDTAGFVSSDFHVHGIRSADSRIPDGRRVEQFAGEGVENIVMTDHHVHTDLSAEIASLGLGAFVTSTIGEEITTFDYGHFNGYPFTIDASKPSGGSTDWGQAAPVGQDFPSYGNYNATPSEIFTLATLGAQSTPDTTIQVNHINSHFEPLQIDTSVAGAVSDGLDAAERAALRLPVGPNLFQHFPALELWNGMDRGHQSEFLDGRIGVWFNHLNKGLRTTVISDTDTHEYTNLRTAG
ncbi:MAG: hypothetical protein CL910_20425, partial [Deltaproteobacteria bacterium]|nr:hypothetical protein [Deltaproteobacteria bacterium]